MVNVGGLLGGLAGGAVVVVTIKAIDQFSRTFKKAGGGVSKLGTAFSVGVTSVAAFSTAMIGASVGIVSLAKQGSKAIAVQESFNKLLGKNSTEVLEKSRKAIKGTVSDFELMTNADIFFQNIAGATPEQFEEVTRAAGPLARAVGLSVPEAFNRMVQGIAKGETELLDELGLKLDATVANKKYAESLGITVGALTAQDRAMAALLNVLPNIEERMQNLPTLQDDLNTSTEKMNAQWSNMTNELGKGLIPAATTLLMVFNEQLLPVLRDEVFPFIQNDLAPAIVELAPLFGEFLADSVRGSVSAIKQLLPILVPLLKTLLQLGIAAIPIMNKGLQLFIPLLAAIATPLQGLINAFIKLVELLKQAASFIGKSTLGEVLGGALSTGNRATGFVGRAIGNIGGNIVEQGNNDFAPGQNMSMMINIEGSVMSEDQLASMLSRAQSNQLNNMGTL